MFLVFPQTSKIIQHNSLRCLVLKNFELSINNEELCEGIKTNPLRNIWALEYLVTINIMALNLLFQEMFLKFIENTSDFLKNLNKISAEKC